MSVERKTVTITDVQYMSSNGDGSPRHRVITNQGTWPTTPGGQVGYGITNSEFRGEVILTIDGGDIVGVSTVDGSSFTGRQS
nr:hypothetical protein [Rhodococcus sp. (in: high G+C Gram-positive bacteria)]